MPKLTLYLGIVRLNLQNVNIWREGAGGGQEHQVISYTIVKPVARFTLGISRL